jgi:site-specific recombinase XerD
MIGLKEAHKTFVTHLETQGKSPATLTAYNKDIEQLTKFLENEGLVLVTEIQTTHLEVFMKKLSDSKYTAKSISRKTNATKTFFKFLQDMKHIVENVSTALKHPKLDTKAPRILTKLEYRALRDAARDDLRSYSMIEVLLQTGLTISELAEMEVEHLDIKADEGNLFVPKKNNKTSRTIPLNKAAIEVLNKYMETERPKLEKAKHVFITKTGNPLLVRNIRSTIDRFFKLAGVEKAKVNDLRHTFVSYHLSQGVNILKLSKIAGHKRVSTTERYLEYVEKATVQVERADLSAL